MAMHHPSKAYYREGRKTCLLQFAKNNPPPMECVIRGGIALPQFEPARNEIVGYAVVCGLDVDTKKIYVFEQQAFSSIDHIMTDDLPGQRGPVIEYEGVSSFLNRCWLEYFSRRYHTFDHADMIKKYKSQIHKSLMIKPKPYIMPIHRGDTEGQAEHTMRELLQNNRLFIDKSSQLADTLLSYEARAIGVDAEAEVRALLAVLTAYDVHRWREPR